MNNETITIQDCLDAYELHGWRTILENGQVTGFEKEGVRVES